MDAHAAIADQARLTRQRLTASILPYWLEHSRDDAYGGFLLPDDVVRGALRRTTRRLLRGPLPTAATSNSSPRRAWCGCSPTRGSTDSTTGVPSRPPAAGTSSSSGTSWTASTAGTRG